MLKVQEYNIAVAQKYTYISIQVIAIYHAFKYILCEVQVDLIAVSGRVD
jgi:hypothetical protein